MTHLKAYVRQRSFEAINTILKLLDKESLNRMELFEMERAKTKEYEADRLLRFLTGTEYIEETEYYSNLKTLFGV